jgi:hypothetical protein
MRSEQQLPSLEPRHVFKVSVWKTKPDASAPWWQRWFHRFVYLPFQNFSITVMKIPPVKQVVIESNSQGSTHKTFGWFEDIAIFEHEEQADAGCLTESEFYTRLPFGRLMPEESAQYEYGAPTFPRRKNPKRWAKPVLSLIIKDRKEDEKKDQTLAAALTKLNQVLDRR